MNIRRLLVINFIFFGHLKLNLATVMYIKKKRGKLIGILDFKLFLDK